MKKIFISIAIAACVISCRVADFTLLSTKNVDLKAPAQLLQAGVTGRGFDLKSAVDHAIEKVPGGMYLQNIVIYDTGLRYKVKADVWGAPTGK